jgi:hypothetical protein
MTTRVITPAEAMEEIERLRISVEFNGFSQKWYAITAHASPWDIASGATAMEAVTELLGRMAEAETANA